MAPGAPFIILETRHVPLAPSALRVDLRISTAVVLHADEELHPRVRQALALVEVWLDAQRDFQEIPGLSAAIVHDDAILWRGAVGYADLERKTPASPETVYSICSISKLFTSVAIMQLRDAGRLRLDDPVARHLPWFKIRQTDPRSPVITIEGLLTHSSGLPRESDFPYWTAPEFTFPTREDMIKALSRQETLHTAGTYFQYSNLGMALLGEIVAKASGEPYDAYVKQRILDALGLTSTTPEMPVRPGDPRLASGYSALQRDGARQPVLLFLTRGLAPAAGYTSSVEDLGRFAAWQFRLLARRGGDEVLNANTLREMQRIHWVDPDFETMWGLGFCLRREKQKTYVGHGGSCPGFRAQLLLHPPENMATVFMANAQGVNAGEFALQMHDIVAPALKAAAKEGGKPKRPDRSLEKYTGVYATGFAGEIAIIEWEDGLAAVPLPTMTPMEALAKLKKSGDHTFRRVRKDESLAEGMVFEMGKDGRAARLLWHSNHYRRVK